MDKVTKIFSSEIKEIGEPDERVLRFVTSTESVDRDGDIIEVAGWQLENYKKNPVILWGHDYHGLPIGKTVSIQIDPIARTLVQDVKFPTADEYPFADTVYKLAKGGYLNATSVGFVGIESESRRNDKGDYIGRLYKKQELLETSVVPVPSNPTALMQARSKGLINESEFELIQKEWNPAEPTEKGCEDVDKEPENKTVEPPETVEKIGASISAKNRAIMDEIMGHLRSAMEMMSEIMGGEMEPEMEPEEDGCGDGRKPKSVGSDDALEGEFKDTIDLLTAEIAAIKAQLSPSVEESKAVPDNPDSGADDIDIESIEYTPASADDGADEINVTEEELRALIRATVQELIPSKEEL